MNTQLSQINSWHDWLVGVSYELTICDLWDTRHPSAHSHRDPFLIKMFFYTSYILQSPCLWFFQHFLSVSLIPRTPSVLFSSTNSWWPKQGCIQLPPPLLLEQMSEEGSISIPVFSPSVVCLCWSKHRVTSLLLQPSADPDPAWSRHPHSVQFSTPTSWKLENLWHNLKSRPIFSIEVKKNRLQRLIITITRLSKDGSPSHSIHSPGARLPHSHSWYREGHRHRGESEPKLI